jgi:hypothetical protein
MKANSNRCITFSICDSFDLFELSFLTPLLTFSLLFWSDGLSGDALPYLLSVLIQTPAGSVNFVWVVIVWLGRGIGHFLLFQTDSRDCSVIFMSAFHPLGAIVSSHLSGCSSRLWGR